MTINGHKGTKVKNGLWRFNIPQFVNEKNFEVNPEWLLFRENYIGSSDIASVLGLQDPKYGKSSAQLFCEKVGLYMSPFTGNQFTYWGRIQEKNIIEAWSRYDGTEDGYIGNEPIRKYRELRGYWINEKYPWIAVSPDFVANKGQLSYFTGEIIESYFDVETKTASFYSVEKWKYGIPSNYYAQKQLQMAVMETDYSEIAMVINGNELKVMPIYKDEEFCEKMLEKSKDFWEDRVEPAKGLMKLIRDLDSKSQGVSEESEKYMGYIDQLEPDGDDSESYHAFMKDRYRETLEEVEGEGRIDFRNRVDDEQRKRVYELCCDYKRYDLMGKGYESRKQGVKNKFISEFPEISWVQLSENSRLINRRREGKRDYFNVSIDPEDMEKIKCEVENYFKNKEQNKKL